MLKTPGIRGFLYLAVPATTRPHSHPDLPFVLQVCRQWFFGFHWHDFIESAGKRKQEVKGIDLGGTGVQQRLEPPSPVDTKV